MESSFEGGKTASSTQLCTALRSAALPYVEGALSNPALTPNHLLILLRNPAVTPALIMRLGENAAWLKSPGVRAAIALHPKTPRVVVAALIPHLGWRDLARMTDGRSLTPGLRRLAERQLEARIEEMTQGERVSMAHMAQRGVIALLCGDDSPRVIGALLQNPRLVENDVLRIASRRRAPAGVMHAVALSERFGRRPEVRKAVARHPNTPPTVALGLLQQLRAPALKEIARSSPRTPRLIQVAAGRLIDACERPGRGSTGSSRRRR